MEIMDFNSRSAIYFCENLGTIQALSKIISINHLTYKWPRYPNEKAEVSLWIKS